MNAVAHVHEYASPFSERSVAASAHVPEFWQGLEAHDDAPTGGGGGFTPPAGVSHVRPVKVGAPNVSNGHVHVYVAGGNGGVVVLVVLSTQVAPFRHGLGKAAQAPPVGGGGGPPADVSQV